MLAIAREAGLEVMDDGPTRLGARGPQLPRSARRRRRPRARARGAVGARTTRSCTRTRRPEASPTSASATSKAASHPAAERRGADPVVAGRRPDPGAEVVLAEGEPDALAAVSALNGDPVCRLRDPGYHDPGGAGQRPSSAPPAASTWRSTATRPGARRATRSPRALQRYTTSRWSGSATARISRVGSTAKRIARAGCSKRSKQAPVAPKVRSKAEDRRLSQEGRRPHPRSARQGHRPRAELELGDLLDRLVDYVETYVVLPVVERGEERYERAVADLLALWIASHLDLLRLVGDAVLAGHERGARVGEELAAGGSRVGLEHGPGSR